MFRSFNAFNSLRELAGSYRRSLPPTTHIIAITGVSETTTTTEMIAAVLSQRFGGVMSNSNTKDLIRVPLHLLRIEAEHDFGIFELHTNRFGEIRPFAELVQPNIGVITNTGVAPDEFLGAEYGIADEMGSLLEALPTNGFAILNADDRWCNALRLRTRAKVFTIGIDNVAHIFASDIKLNGGVSFRLNIARKPDHVIIRLKGHDRLQIYSALQASAVGYFLGMELEEICEGLESIEVQIAS